MKHFILGVVGVVLTACASSVTQSVEPMDKLAEIRARGTLIIATDEDYLPLSQLIPASEPNPETRCESTQYTSDQIKGFDADVARELARQLGVEPCFVTPPWSQLIAGNWGNNWDIHVGSVAITYDRMKNLYFTQPYYATPTVLLVHQDNINYKSPEDLSGKRVGVCAGCTFESYLKGTLEMPGQEIIYRIQNAQIVAYENEEPAIAALSLGDGVELDAAITLLPKARAAVEAGKPVRILDDRLMFAYASITIDRAGNRDPYTLFVESNGIINDLHQNGTLKDLSMKYFGLDLTQEAALYLLSTLNQSP